MWRTHCCLIVSSTHPTDENTIEGANKTKEGESEGNKLKNEMGTISRKNNNEEKMKQKNVKEGEIKNKNKKCLSHQRQR